MSSTCSRYKYIYIISILSISSESLHFSYGHVDCYTENIDIWNSDLEYYWTSTLTRCRRILQAHRRTSSSETQRSLTRPKPA